MGRGNRGKGDRRGRGGGGGGGRGRGRGRGGGRSDGQSRDNNGSSAGNDNAGYGNSWKDNPENFFNPAFESYYLEQRLLDSADEWKALMRAFRQPLPTTFRITSGVPTAVLLEDAMNTEWVPFLSNVKLPRVGADAGLRSDPSKPNLPLVADGEAQQQVTGADPDTKAEEGSADANDSDTFVPPPSKIPFYRPYGLGWQLDVKKNVIRKHPAFKAFQQWLVHETDSGAISRQEAVSMVPPLFLDVRSDHLVLDMCAAPGSKTAQLVEMLHTRGPSTSAPLPRGQYDATPEGLVLANDSDNKRAHMLVHQASRIPSPNLMVSNLDASMLPRIDVPWLPPTSPDAPPPTRHTMCELKFDRILADVPCSGDGTLRKNVPIWKDWHSQNGLGLHPLQLRILLRGLALLREGGRLVYSTCSLNPLENEAVVAAALREHGALNADGGDVHLVDVSSEIPELTRRPGKRSWKVTPGRGKHLYAGGSKDESATASAVEEEEGEKQPTSTDTTGPVDYVDYEHFISTIFAGQNPQEVKADAVRQTEDGSNIKLTCQRSDMRDRALDSTWLPNFPYVDSWEQLRERDPSLAGRTPKTLWPPASDEIADKLDLERCMRFYPHLQNTGGFFVAVLEKRAPKGGYPHGEQGLAAGMRRAIERFDDLKASGTASAAVSAPTNGVKRDLSPDPESSTSDAKRAKVETPTDQSAAQGVPTVADPNSHIKADNHAVDRAAKASKQAIGAADFGHGQPNGMPYHEDPMTFLTMADPEVQSVIDYFKLSIDAASADANGTLRFEPRNLLSRNAEGKMVRGVSLVSYSVRAIIAGGGKPNKVPKKDDDGKVELDGDGEVIMTDSPHPHLNPVRLRLMSAGVKLFQRQDSTKASLADINVPSCRWRVTSDGLLVLLPFLNAEQKIVKISMNELAFLMSTSYPSLYDIEEQAPALLPKVRKMVLGSHIVQVGGEDAVDEPELGPNPAGTSTRPDGEEDGARSNETRAQRIYRAREQWIGKKLPVSIALPIWKASASVNLMIDKQVKSAMSYRLFGCDLSSATGERQFNAAPPSRKKGKGGRGADQELGDTEDAAMAAAASALAST
ncbi:tRNA (cytosine-5-)-methyltransferase ncl1 [Tilletia horrida]|nr:tRNA (cytosine-5-)-methyltransferase ncl1 [Tilletia horrida]